MMEKGKEKVVHIFPQPDNHQEALIIGNKNGLIALRDAINKTLETGKGGCILMPADGENFECKILMNNEDWQEPFWQRMKVPYAELADNNSTNFGPEIYTDYNLVKSEEIPKVEAEIERNRKTSEEWMQKIMDSIEKNK